MGVYGLAMATGYSRIIFLIIGLFSFRLLGGFGFIIFFGATGIVGGATYLTIGSGGKRASIKGTSRFWGDWRA